MKIVALLTVSHVLVALLGFAGGIYVLPIIAAPPAPTLAEVRAATVGARFNGRFERDLAGSDPLHWGEGTVYVGDRAIALHGRLTPGPSYKLYLAPRFVQTGADFLAVKSASIRVGDIDTFENFIVPVPATVQPGAFDTVVVWCEAFGQFITAARYR